MTKDEFHDKAKVQDSNGDTEGKKVGSASSVIHFHAPQFSGPRVPAPRPSFAGGMPMAMNIKPLPAEVPTPAKEAVVKNLHFFSAREDKGKE